MFDAEVSYTFPFNVNRGSLYEPQLLIAALRMAAWGPGTDHVCC